MKVKINGIEYPILIIRKRIKHMYLRTSIDGTLIITCGNKVSIKDILIFIEQKVDWIEKSIKKQQKIKNGIDNLFNEESLIFLGKNKKILKNKSIHNKIVFDENYIEFNLKKVDEDNVKNEFYKFSKLYLVDTIEKMRIKWDLMLLDYCIYEKPILNVKQLKSRWGFCVPSKNKITINTNIIHYPIECLDYLLLHEYAHLIQPNHSKKFYDILSKYMPDYKIYMKLLRNNY